MTVLKIDHVAFAVADLDRSVCFYVDVLGGVIQGEPHRVAGRPAVQRVALGAGLLSIHQAGGGAVPVAAAPVVGALDICFEWDGEIASAISRVATHGLSIIEGPVGRMNVRGEAAHSIYFRDPDGNLVELMAADRQNAAPA